nr:ribosomal protein L12 [Ostreobium quekettii]
MDIAFLYQITEIIEKLKSITLLEATELIKQIEETFGVDTSKVSEQSQILTTNKDVKTVETKDKEEVSSFDIILQEVPSEEERSKRLTVFRIIRELTSLGLRESKELTNSLPKSIKESVSKQEAEEAKKQLEAVGAKVLIQ